MDFTTGGFVPGNGHLLDLVTVIQECGEEIHIEGEACDVKFRLDLLKESTRDELEATLTVIDWNVQNFRNERGVNAADEMTTKVTLDGFSEHFDA